MKTLFTHLKFSWNFLVGYKRIFFVGVFLKVINLALSLFTPLLYAELITAISTSETTKALYVLAFIIGFQIFTLLLTYLIGRIENYIIKNVNCRTQKILENQVLTIPPYLMDEYNEGSLYSIVVRDSACPISYIYSIVNVLFSVITLIGIGCIIFVLSWELSLVILCSYPIVYIINRIYGKKLRKKQSEWIASSDNFISYLKSIIGAINFIKENKGKDKIEKAFDSKLEDLKKKNSDLEVLKLNNNVFSGIMGVISYAAMNIVGIVLIIVGKLLFSSFVAFNSYSTKFSSSLDSLVSLNATLQPTFVTFQRLEHLNDLYNQALEFNAEKKSADVNNLQVSANEISISLSNKMIFENISFMIDAGQILKLNGKNGCGKTTILKIIMQEYMNYEGSITIGGNDLKSINYESIQDNVTFLQQNAPLLQLSLFDNLTLFDSEGNIQEDMVIKACSDVGLWEDINLLPDGLYTEVNDKFSLSAGQIQKLQLARAILKNTPIVLIDEIAANLDQKSLPIISELCKKMREEGKLVIYVSHIKEESEIADKILDFAM